MDLIELQEVIASRIARHIESRVRLDVAAKYATAERIVKKRGEEWARWFRELTRIPNAFRTKREIARACGISMKQCERFWSDLRRIEIVTPAGSHRLFRDDQEMRFRHSGKVGDENVVGGICLHLANQPPMGYADEQTITATTQPALEVIADNALGSERRQAGELAESEDTQRDAVRTVDEIVRGVRGEQLALVPKTGTDDGKK